MRIIPGCQSEKSAAATIAQAKRQLEEAFNNSLGTEQKKMSEKGYKAVVQSMHAKGKKDHEDGNAEYDEVADEVVTTAPDGDLYLENLSSGEDDA